MTGNCNLTDKERNAGMLCRSMFCDKCKLKRIEIVKNED